MVYSWVSRDVCGKALYSYSPVFKRSLSTVIFLPVLSHLLMNAMRFLCCPDWSWISRLKPFSCLSLLSSNDSTYLLLYLALSALKTNSGLAYASQIFPVLHIASFCTTSYCSCTSTKSHLYWLYCLSCVLSNSKQSILVLTSLSKNTPVLSHWILTQGTDHLLPLLLLTSPSVLHSPDWVQSNSTHWVLALCTSCIWSGFNIAHPACLYSLHHYPDLRHHLLYNSLNPYLSKM